MFSLLSKKVEMPTHETALPGRDLPVATSETHFLSGHPLKGPYPEGFEKAIFGLGCFWGAERLFWQLPGVYLTAVGYSAGYSPNPTYEEVCTGQTGHNEVVLVVFDPQQTSYEALLKSFWEAHDPTQGMRQGNDVGTQYRSGLYVFGEDQKSSAEASKAAYQSALTHQGHDQVTTEIREAGPFYFAEEYHQQYLAKNPDGYCGLGGLGISCPMPAPKSD